MRRLLAIWSAVGLLCGALGCQFHDAHCIHGRCDCDGPGYGCHYDYYEHSYGHGGDVMPHGGDAMLHGHLVAPPGAPSVEPIKEMPKVVSPKDEKE
jgi:hypothetical protein